MVAVIIVPGSVAKVSIWVDNMVLDVLADVVIIVVVVIVLKFPLTVSYSACMPPMKFPLSTTLEEFSG